MKDYERKTIVCEYLAKNPGASAYEIRVAVGLKHHQSVSKLLGQLRLAGVVGRDTNVTAPGVAHHWHCEPKWRECLAAHIGTSEKCGPRSRKLMVCEHLEKNPGSKARQIEEAVGLRAKSAVRLLPALEASGCLWRDPGTGGAGSRWGVQTNWREAFERMVAGKPVMAKRQPEMSRNPLWGAWCG